MADTVRPADRNFLLAPLLDEPDVVEVSANPSPNGGCDIWVSRFGHPPALWGHLERSEVERFIRWCATGAGGRIARDSPILSGRVPGTAHRIEALHPPVVETPCLSIRRHTDTVVSLEGFVPDPEPRALIAGTVARRGNILVAGATGSGKTTLLNACLDELARVAPDTRLVAIEDTPEIRSPLANTLCLRTGDAVGMDRLLVSALRLAPDRIVVGEVREGAVLMTLAKAWNTGHPGGITTLHANSAAEALPRLRMLATEVTAADPTPMLLATMDVVVFVRRGRERPEVATVAVVGPDGMETLFDTGSPSTTDRERTAQ